MFADLLPWLLLGLLSLTTLGLGTWLLVGRQRGARHAPRSHGDRSAGGRVGPLAEAPLEPHPQTPYLPASPARYDRESTYDREPRRQPEPALDHDQGRHHQERPVFPAMPPEERALTFSESSGYSDPGGRSMARIDMQAPDSGAPPPLPRRPALGSSFPRSPSPRPTAMIHGQVREAGGGVIAGASLTLIDLAGGQIGRGATASDGSYSLPVPSAGSYFLIARARAHHPQASTVTVAEQPVSLAIVLTGLAELSGLVRVADSDEPVPSALVTLLDMRGEVIDSTSADLHGRYRFAELVGGSYTLAASASPFRPAARLVTVSDSGPTVQDIELSAGAYLRGTALGGRDLRPVQDARVTLLDAEGNVVGVVRTDASGEYMFNDVPEGHYTLQATGYPPVTANLQVFSGRKHEHDVELRHPED
ncbi:MAG: hypothetical protein GEU94_00505 [Micromonosporaceae bacterium]|nr:hypothetical protein [Micromonosporaceae bacterium]